MKHTRPTPRRVASVATLLVLAALSACSSDQADDDAAPATEPSQTSTPITTQSTGGPTPITITADGRTFTATLNESDVSQDLIEKLTKMGEITSGLTAFRELPDDVEMRIELS